MREVAGDDARGHGNEAASAFGGILSSKKYFFLFCGILALLALALWLTSRALPR